MLGISPLVGCRACSTGYDYSSPVADSVCGTDGHSRAGSILSGGACVSGNVVYEGSIPEEVPAPAEPTKSDESTPAPEK
jgi:hypothetical protein